MKAPLLNVIRRGLVIFGVLSPVVFVSKSSSALTDTGNFPIILCPEISRDSAPSFQTAATLNAAANKVGFLFRIPKTGTITKIGFRTGTVTVSDTLRVRLQTVNASYQPSGTDYGGSSSGTVSGLASNTTYEVTLSASASAVAGDLVAVVVEFNSYVAGNLTISGIQTVAGTPVGAVVEENTGSWGAPANTGGITWLVYSDNTCAPLPGVNAIKTTTSTPFNSSSSPNRYSLKFSIPFAANLYAVRFGAILGTGAASVKVSLVDSLGVTTDLTPEISTQTANGSASRRTYYVALSTPASISANTSYRLEITPQNTTSITLDFFTFHSSSTVRQSVPDGFLLSSRTDTGAFTDDAASLLLIDLYFNKIDAAGGSSSSSATRSYPYPFRWK